MMEDDEIRSLVARLARPHRASGGTVIERAAILAAGADCDAVLSWIAEHDGEPEAAAPVAVAGGLHGARGGSERVAPPSRYLLPPGSLD
jgi:hypothetical protein